jgi:hypothetical protein
VARFSVGRKGRKCPYEQIIQRCCNELVGCLVSHKDKANKEMELDFKTSGGGRTRRMYVGGKDPGETRRSLGTVRAGVPDTVGPSGFEPAKGTAAAAASASPKTAKKLSTVPPSTKAFATMMWNAEKTSGKFIFEQMNHDRAAVTKWMIDQFTTRLYNTIYVLIMRLVALGRPARADKKPNYSYGGLVEKLKDYIGGYDNFADTSEVADVQDYITQWTAMVDRSKQPKNKGLKTGVAKRVSELTKIPLKRQNAA